MSLLAECSPHLFHRMHDGIARGVGPVAKALAYVFETAGNMALAKVIAGRIEIPLRTGAIGIAGGKGQRQRQKAQVGQLHINGSFRPLFRPSRNEFQYYSKKLSPHAHRAATAEILSTQTGGLSSVIPKSSLSQHFKALREAGLIRSERHGVEMRNTSRCRCALSYSTRLMPENVLIDSHSPAVAW
jgi:DNA-binding transcriptional ArsR family regulator